MSGGAMRGGVILSGVARGCVEGARSLLGGISELLYPRCCSACGAELEDGQRALCRECLFSVPLLVDPVCDLCGEPVVAASASRKGLCGRCLRRRPVFDRARSAVSYGRAVKSALLMLKFHHAFWLAKDLGILLEGCVRRHFALAEIDAIVPVPLHSLRRRQRTMNQAELLARELGRRLSLPVMTDLLRRSRQTLRQTDLSREERRRNLRGAFEVKQRAWVEQRVFLVVDDVMTTGETVSAVSHALKRSGAAGVWVATVARGTQSVVMDERAERGPISGGVPDGEE